MAVSAHALMALPTGALGTRGRRTGAALLYAVAVVGAAALWLGPGELSVPAGAQTRNQKPGTRNHQMRYRRRTISSAAVDARQRIR